MKIKCPHCNGRKLRKAGHNESGTQRYLCKTCGKKFTPGNTIGIIPEGVECFYCHSTNLKKGGHLASGSQRYQCKDCGRYFSDKTIEREPITDSCTSCGSNNIRRCGHNACGSQRYICRDCGKRFTINPMTKQAPRFDKECPICHNKKAVRAGHTGQGKQYWKCTECGHKFLTDGKYTHLTEVTKELIVELLQAGLNKVEIAKQLGISVRSVYDYTKGMPIPWLENRAIAVRERNEKRRARIEQDRKLMAEKRELKRVQEEERKAKRAELLAYYAKKKEEKLKLKAERKAKREENRRIKEEKHRQWFFKRIRSIFTQGIAVKDIDLNDYYTEFSQISDNYLKGLLNDYYYTIRIQSLFNECRQEIVVRFNKKKEEEKRQVEKTKRLTVIENDKKEWTRIFDYYTVERTKYMNERINLLNERYSNLEINNTEYQLSFVKLSNEIMGEMNLIQKRYDAEQERIKQEIELSRKRAARRERLTYGEGLLQQYKNQLSEYLVEIPEYFEETFNFLNTKFADEELSQPAFIEQIERLLNQTKIVMLERKAEKERDEEQERKKAFCDAVLHGKNIDKALSEFSMEKEEGMKLVQPLLDREWISESQKNMIVKYGIMLNVPVDYLAEYVPCSENMCIKILNEYRNKSFSIKVEKQDKESVKLRKKMKKN